VDVVPQGLARLLLAALEVPGVSWAHVRPLEFPDEDLLELCPTMDAVGWQEFEPRSNMLPDIDGEVLDDEAVIRPSGSIGEPKIFQPYSRVRLPGVLGDVGGRLEVWQECCFLDAMTEGPWARAIRTGVPVAVLIARSAATPVGHLLVLPLGLVGISHIRSSPIDISAAAGQLS
jgi:hypothetical protein